MQHWTYLLPIFLVFGLFVWLNFDFSRDAYEERTASGHRGGIRHGFPFVLWDSGIDARASEAGTLKLSIREYGGWVWSGVALNGGSLLLALLGSVACSRVLRRAAFQKQPDGDALVAHAWVHPLTPVVLMTLAGTLLWVNLTPETEIVLRDNGSMDFEQSLGWPLTHYKAHQPRLNASARHYTPEVILAHLRARPDAAFRFAHWYEERLVGNILIGVVVALGAAGATERALKRRES